MTTAEMSQAATEAAWSGTIEVHAMAGGVDLDATFFISAILFLFVYFVLSKALFQPYVAIEEEREKLTKGRKEHAEKLQARAADAVQRYEKKIAAARSEAAGVREGLRKEAQDRELSIIEEAREQAMGQLTSQRERIEDAVEGARGEVDERAKELAETIVQRIMPSA